MRPSIGTTEREEDDRWKRVIRYFAIVIAILGLVIVGHEIFENIVSNGSAKMHLSTMIWGVVFLSSGLLILQRGDVTTSIREVVSSGSTVRTWLRPGREGDAAGTKVTTTVIEPPKPEEKG